MRLTCLSKGGGYHFPPCHIVNVCGFWFLLDCPLDLSALTIFSPIPTNSNAMIDEDSDCSPHTSLDSEYCQKRQKMEKPLDASNLICSEPCYKTVKSLHLWDITFIDVVLISSPMGMLGLPFLTRTKGFSAKIYATEAAVRLGQLMMEDLVTMNMDFRQFYGPRDSSFPKWMKWEELEVLPATLKERACGRDGSEIGGWMTLYSDDSDTQDEIIKLLLNTDDNSEEMEKLAFISSCVIDSVKDGGSVLIPIGRLGIVLQLLESISISLESLNLKVPMFIISSVAEELLAFSNIIPEWLCKKRQEKLYFGEPLFAHVDLIKEKKLHLFPGIHSDKLLKIWQEPCIVFCSHWSLRLGPVVHLLRRWCGNQNSLLVMEEGVDADLRLLPFKPMAMKILQCSFLSGMKLQKVQALLKMLQPKVVLFPEALRRHFCFSSTSPISFIHYSENETLRVPSLKLYPEFEIATDFASQLNWKNLNQENISIARLKGELSVEHSKHRLLSGNDQVVASSQSRMLLHWGSVNLQNLVTALQDMGINASVERGMSDAEPEYIARVLEPNRALIEINAARTVISTADEKLTSHIFEVICKGLDGI